MFSRTFRLSLVIVVVLTAASMAFAQSSGAIRGRITDALGSGISGAVVSLYTRDDGARKSVTTDANGEYRFDRLAPGSYIVETQASGFARAAARSIRIESDRNAVLDVSLQVRGVNEAVIVTASGAPQTVDEVSKAVSSIGNRELLERDEYDVSEALRTVPGLRVQRQGGPGSFVSIKTRGLRNEDTAILIDGMRFRDAAAPQGDATGFLEDLVVTNADRVEVLRGSGSSLYGSNAIGGVINLLGDEGGGRTRGSALLEGGTLGHFRGKANLAGGFKNDRLTYSGGATHVNVTNGVDGDDAWRNTSGQGSVGYRLSPSSMITTRFYSSGSLLHLNTGPQAVGNFAPTGIISALPLPFAELRRFETGTPIPQLSLGTANFIPSADNPDWIRKARFFSGSLKFSQRLNEAFGYSVSYQALVTNRSLLDGPAGVGFQPIGKTRTDYDARIHTVNSRFNLRLGRYHTVDAGYEFESENFFNRTLAASATDNSSVDVTQRANAFFAQDQIRLFDDRLQLSASFRAQHFTLDRPRFDPVASSPYQGASFQAPPNAYTGDGSIAYFFRGSGTKLRAHVGNGYRAPSLYERFGTYYSGGFGYSTYGDPRLRPDRAIAVDGGIDQNFMNGRVRTAATYFYTRLQETVIFDFSGGINPAKDPFGRYGGYLNGHGGLARGLEISAGMAPAHSLDITASYTYTNADQRTPVVLGTVHSLIVPDHQFSIVATQRIGKRMFVNLDLSAIGSYLAPLFDSRTFASRAFRFDGFAKADLGVSYRVPLADYRALRLYLKIENLLNNSYYESGFRMPGATAMAGIHFEF